MRRAGRASGRPRRSPSTTSAAGATPASRPRSVPSCSNCASRRSRVTTAVPMCPRSFVSTLIPTPQPPCSGPSRRSAGSDTSVKTTSSNSADPVIWRSGRTSIPGRSIGQRKNEIPSCLRAPGSVRAMRMPQLLTRPPEHHTLAPLTTKWSPSRSARVDSDARSLPAPASENSWHHTWSAVNVARRCSSRCSAVPWRRMAPPASTSPTMLSTGGTPARAHSTSHAPWCSSLRPRPPCSTGQWIPA